MALSKSVWVVGILALAIGSVVIQWRDERERVPPLRSGLSQPPAKANAFAPVREFLLSVPFVEWTKWAYSLSVGERRGVYAFFDRQPSYQEAYLWKEQWGDLLRQYRVLMKFPAYWETLDERTDSMRIHDYNSLLDMGFFGLSVSVALGEWDEALANVSNLFKQVQWATSSDHSRIGWQWGMIAEEKIVQKILCLARMETSPDLFLDGLASLLQQQHFGLAWQHLLASEALNLSQAAHEIGEGRLRPQDAGLFLSDPVQVQLTEHSRPLPFWEWHPNRTQNAIQRKAHFILSLEPRDYQTALDDIRKYEKVEKRRNFLPFQNPGGKLFLKSFYLSPIAFVEAKCRMETLRDGALLVIGCQKYWRERKHFPSTLQELVPVFLKEIPKDPFDGDPFRYCVDKGVIYSIGKDRVDNGGGPHPSSCLCNQHGRRNGETCFVSVANQADVLFFIRENRTDPNIQ